MFNLNLKHLKGILHNVEPHFVQQEAEKETEK